MKGGITMEKEEQKKLLNVKDLCACLNIGETKARTYHTERRKSPEIQYLCGFEKFCTYRILS